MEEIRLNGSPIMVLSGQEEPNRTDRHHLEIKEEKLKKACADFESIFINFMLKTMRNTVPQSKTNKLPGKDIYAAMIDQKVAEDLAKRGGGIGLQEMLLRQLKSGGGDQGSGIND